MDSLKKSGLVIGLLLLFVMSVTLVHAQELIIYPAKGQSAEQQEKDKTDCYTWAKQQTGVDPIAMAQAQASAAPPPSTAPQGERVRGAAKGAAAGAIIGGIAGDAGQGAAIGAAAGTMSGGAQQRGKAAATEDAQKQADAKWKQDMANYNKAYSACLEGKGYTVK